MGVTVKELRAWAEGDGWEVKAGKRGRSRAHLVAVKGGYRIRIAQAGGPPRPYARADVLDPDGHWVRAAGAFLDTLSIDAGGRLRGLRSGRAGGVGLDGPGPHRLPSRSPAGARAGTDRRWREHGAAPPTVSV